MIGVTGAPSRRLPKCSSDSVNTVRKQILGGLWGAMVGDALGVPVEFKSRAERQRDPVVDMRANGSHRQPKGTWSDDGSLILCTVDSLIRHEFDTEDMGKRFAAWFKHNLWTPHGEVFDVGGTTTEALTRLQPACELRSLVRTANTATEMARSCVSFLWP